MPKHRIRIIQVTRVERSIVVDVEADSIEAAIEAQAESEAPSLDDSRWETISDSLENEEVTAA